MVSTRGMRIPFLAIGTIAVGCAMPMQATAQCDWCRACSETEIEVLDGSSPDAEPIAEAIGGEGCFYNQGGCDSGIECVNDDADADLAPEPTLDGDALVEFSALLSEDDLVGLRRFADRHTASLQLIPHRALLAFKAPCGTVFAIKQLTPLQALVFVSAQAAAQRAYARGEQPGDAPSTP